MTDEKLENYIISINEREGSLVDKKRAYFVLCKCVCLKTTNEYGFSYCTRSSHSCHKSS